MTAGTIYIQYFCQNVLGGSGGIILPSAAYSTGGGFSLLLDEPGRKELTLTLYQNKVSKGRAKERQMFVSPFSHVVVVAAAVNVVFSSVCALFTFLLVFLDELDLLKQNE